MGRKSNISRIAYRHQETTYNASQQSPREMGGVGEGVAQGDWDFPFSGSRTTKSLNLSNLTQGHYYSAGYLPQMNAAWGNEISF